MKNYLYISTSGDGWTNLGTDEWFLEHIAPDEMALYFYINDNAVILGRNQNPWAECDLAAMERDHVQLVRRITGGGAVYHDRGNLNFSFIAGSERYDQDRQLRLILEAVRALGIPCEATGRNDLAVEGRKFSGNAFCKRSKVQAAPRHAAGRLRSGSVAEIPARRSAQAALQGHQVRARPRLQFERLSARPARGSAARGAARLPSRANTAAYETLKTEDLPWADIRPYIEKHASWDWRLGETPQFDLEDRKPLPLGQRAAALYAAPHAGGGCARLSPTRWIRSFPTTSAPACSAAASAPSRLRRRWRPRTRRRRAKWARSSARRVCKEGTA